MYLLINQTIDIHSIPYFFSSGGNIQLLVEGTIDGADLIVEYSPNFGHNLFTGPTTYYDLTSTEMTTIGLSSIVFILPGTLRIRMNGSGGSTDISAAIVS